jgi:hypothetical protein
MSKQQPHGDLRNAKWLDPQCYEAGACQSLAFKQKTKAVNCAAVRIAPAAWWIPKAEQFCIPKPQDGRPFAAAWEPLYTQDQLDAAVSEARNAFSANPAAEVLIDSCADHESRIEAMTYLPAGTMLYAKR